MHFKQTRLKGAYLVEPNPLGDERGYFMRTFCVIEFAHAGLQMAFVQHNVSYTRLKGTIRGMHFQLPPHSETKVVSCLRGAIHDVIIDLRPNSKTYLKWQAFELSAKNQLQLYVPAGFAHGFQTLTDDVEVSYLISEFYVPHAAAGVRHDDPAFAIRWPLPVSVISQKDRNWPRFKPPTPRKSLQPRKSAASPRASKTKVKGHVNNGQITEIPAKPSRAKGRSR